jgi:hypothetical protein
MIKSPFVGLRARRDATAGFPFPAKATLWSAQSRFHRRVAAFDHSFNANAAASSTVNLLFSCLNVLVLTKVPKASERKSTSYKNKKKQG